MEQITIHEFDRANLEWFLSSRKRRIDKLVIKSLSNYKHLASLHKEALISFAVSSALKADNNKRYFFDVGYDAVIQLVDVKSRSGQKVTVMLHGSDEVIEESEIDERLSAGEWMQAWNLAIILRDNNAIADLYKTDISSVKPLNDKDHIRIGDINFRFFYSLGLDNNPDMNLFDEMESILLRNMNFYYMPDVAEFPYPNYFFSFNRALILKAIVESDQNAFTKHLFEGVVYHKEYWGQKVGLNRGDTPLCDDPKGFISWPLTALAAMAYDRGLKIEVDSDYIPLWMVEDKWE